METSVPVQVKIDKDVFENIKKIARKQSYEKDQDISWQDLVREAIYSKYPIQENNKKGK